MKNVNPFLGVGLAIGGSLINAIFGHHREKQPVHVESVSSQAAAEMARGNDRRPQIVILKIEGNANPEQVAVDLANRSRTDRNARIPRNAQDAIAAGMRGGTFPG